MHEFFRLIGMTPTSSKRLVLNQEGKIPTKGHLMLKLVFSIRLVRVTDIKCIH